MATLGDQAEQDLMVAGDGQIVDATAAART